MSAVPTTLPSTVDELTVDWLSGALGTPLAALEVVEVIPGTATKVRVEATPLDPPGAAPMRLCVKGALSGQFGGSFLGAESPYAREALFYADIAPQLQLGLQQVRYAACDARGQGIVVMEDLAHAGGVFGDPCSPFTVDQVAQALELQARWHAAGFGDQAVMGQLPPGGALGELVAEMLLNEAHWSAHFALEASPVLPSTFPERERVLDGFRALWKLSADAPHTLTHGDAHIGNTFVNADGTVTFIDWQAASAAPPTRDVAYFLVGALTVSDRRQHERELLEHYQNALAGHGGPVLGRDVLWRAYARDCLQGFFWAVTPAWMQTPERCVAMAERYVAALEDHDTFTLLAV
jgi:hypothetical protein